MLTPASASGVSHWSPTVSAPELRAVSAADTAILKVMTENDAPRRAAGRPRDESIDERVLAMTRELLLEVGQLEEQTINLHQMLQDGHQRPVER